MEPKTQQTFGFYVQDKMEFDDIIVNVGLRVDQLDPSETAPERADSLVIYEVSKYMDPSSWKEIDTKHRNSAKDRYFFSVYG